MATNFYTYAYLREDGTPYYVGKGTGKRAWKKHFKVPVPKESRRIQLLHTDLTEDQALLLEKQLIAQHGRKDLGTGILINRTDGGEGSTGYVPTDEIKYLCGSSFRGKKQTKEHNEKRANANRGKKRTEETCRKISEALSLRIRKHESIEKQRKAMLGRKYDKVSCPKCSLIGAGGSMKRYHFENCKSDAK